MCTELLLHCRHWKPSLKCWHSYIRRKRKRKCLQRNGQRSGGKHRKYYKNKRLLACANLALVWCWIQICLILLESMMMSWAQVLLCTICRWELLNTGVTLYHLKVGIVEHMCCSVPSETGNCWAHVCYSVPSEVGNCCEWMLSAIDINIQLM